MTEIVHVVLVEWAEPTRTAAADAEALVDQHLGSIPGVIEVQRGAAVRSEGLEDGLQWGLYVRFDSRASLDAYGPHPDHIPVADFLTSHARRLIVFDLAASD
jgi:hypothetical protein